MLKQQQAQGKQQQQLHDQCMLANNCSMHGMPLEMGQQDSRWACVVDTKKQ
jgi:hypothetical protein